MPYKFETEKKFIPYEYDKRRKLTEIQKDEIRLLYGIISQRKIAKMYNVSRRLIVFIGCPEKHKRNLKQRELRGGSLLYYDSEKQKKNI